MADSTNGAPREPGIRLVLGEIRDVQRELRDLKRELRDERREFRDERRASDERFERLIKEFRADSVRRDETTQRMFRGIHSVGLVIARKLDQHTVILRRIDRSLGARRNGRSGNGPAV